ncbi:hypothetical protein BD560DRAFT_392512 [Blakeslea trispora]|nr:hypothetical protein BD560DRAFT_392512 [Blakeslea trispora]
MLFLSLSLSLCLSWLIVKQGHHYKNIILDFTHVIAYRLDKQKYSSLTHFDVGFVYLLVSNILKENSFLSPLF